MGGQLDRDDAKSAERVNLTTVPVTRLSEGAGCWMGTAAKGRPSCTCHPNILNKPRRRCSTSPQTRQHCTSQLCWSSRAKRTRASLGAPARRPSPHRSSSRERVESREANSPVHPHPPPSSLPTSPHLPSLSLSLLPSLLPGIVLHPRLPSSTLSDPLLVGRRPRTQKRQQLPRPLLTPPPPPSTTNPYPHHPSQRKSRSPLFLRSLPRI